MNCGSKEFLGYVRGWESKIGEGVDVNDNWEEGVVLRLIVCDSRGGRGKDFK